MSTNGKRGSIKMGVGVFVRAMQDASRLPPTSFEVSVRVGSN